MNESNPLWTPEYHQKEVDRHYASVSPADLNDKGRVSAGAHRWSHIALSQTPNRKVHQSAMIAHQVAANQGDPASKEMHLKMVALHKAAANNEPAPKLKSAEPFTSHDLDGVAESVSEIISTLKEWESDSLDPVTGPDTHEVNGKQVLTHDTYSSKLKKTIPAGTPHDEWKKLHEETLNESGWKHQLTRDNPRKGSVSLKNVHNALKSQGASTDSADRGRAAQDSKAVTEARAEKEYGTYVFHVKHSHPRDTLGKPETLKLKVRNTISLDRAKLLARKHFRLSGSKIHGMELKGYERNKDGKSDREYELSQTLGRVTKKNK